MKKIKPLMLGLFGLISFVSVADVSFNEKQEKSEFASVTFSEKKIKPERKKKAKSRSIKRSSLKQYEIEGYINKDYVRAVLEMENDKYVVGNIYDKSGKRTYVHGEYVDGALHVYDKKGKHFTIVVGKNK